MVQFINSIHQLMVDLERDDRGPEASPDNRSGRPTAHAAG